MCFESIYNQVKIPSGEVCVEWLNISLLVDETEGCGKYIKLENIKKSKLFSYALVAWFSNFHWHHKLINIYL